MPKKLLEVLPVVRHFLDCCRSGLYGGRLGLAITRAIAAESKVQVLAAPIAEIEPSIIKDIGRVLLRLAWCSTPGAGSGPVA
jgi:urea transport system ATP-binding protein